MVEAIFGLFIGAFYFFSMRNQKLNWLIAFGSTVLFVNALNFLFPSSGQPALITGAPAVVILSSIFGLAYFPFLTKAGRKAEWLFTYGLTALTLGIIMFALTPASVEIAEVVNGVEQPAKVIPLVSWWELWQGVVVGLILTGLGLVARVGKIRQGLPVPTTSK
ncbi:hypothetical protein A2797_00050 [candidate division WWE3 bacterium RIFCSPHIGHO2_01_FULL_48_15]|uniref:Uncharacterized protein n=1 Tax=candidate division WWE3 bacterium RIFCSPHIGHO2_01_FULL_48_15 TaxID=1802619 RepID=A0A1F4VAE7_UNCKA|nr:MAG: hypothetical protein A2797_00050 [candidate division WWE3 bacterium RIFCSPHIGHO2_01_FULL_48_15]